VSSNLAGEFSLRELKTPELAAWAVYGLGGAQRRIDTEDIAVRLFELAPQRFSWKKYPNQINLELVRVYLSDAKKTVHGELLVGSGKTGWALTQKGLAWVETHRAQLLALEAERGLDGRSRVANVDESRRNREARRLRSLDAWQRWSTGDRSISLDEAREAFRLDSYATPAVQEAKLTRLQGMFEADIELREFLSHLSALLNRNTKGAHGPHK
jgi:hypothetical protein